MNKKAVMLLSGGLDSSLAAKMMVDQGIELVALNFTSPFCHCTGKSRGCSNEAVRVAKELNIPIKVVAKGRDYIDIIRNPRFGYGQGVNPCIDCRIFMIKKAKKIMEEQGASFLVTGEVLGQRPMSQRRDAMRLIDRETDSEGIMLRPLSAQHFAPTEAEKARIVDRKKLLNFRGRIRKPQMELAGEIGVDDYPCPSGGCLLTDKNYARRVRDLFARKNGDLSFHDFNLLKLGRIIRMEGDLRVLIGRDHGENIKLAGYRSLVDAFLEPANFPGPSAVILGRFTDEDRRDVGRMILSYAKAPAAQAMVKWSIDRVDQGEFSVNDPFPMEQLKTRYL